MQVLTTRPFALICALASVGCSPETSVRSDAARTTVRTVPCDSVTPTATVTTLGLAYNPTPTTIPVNGIVKFVMPGQHDVTSPASGLAVDFGATTCLAFPDPGTYSFTCSLHGFMGTVTVQQDLGPGASLKCASSQKNAWETYGASAFIAVNEEIFTLVTAEMSANGTTNLGDSFTRVGTGIPPSTSNDLATFKGNLAAFLVFAYGGPESITYTDGKTYVGPQDMVTAHTGLNITSSQYDYFIASIVVPALTNNGVPADDVSSCFAPVVTSAAFKASIVGQ